MKEKTRDALQTGRIKSCGCIHREKRAGFLRSVAKANIGPKNPRFNPSKVVEERSSYPEYKVWRTSVFQRDLYTCQKCRNKGGHLNSHHKNSWNKFPESRFDVSNGITLCFDCHIMFHKMYGRGNNVGDQLLSFLKYSTNCNPK